MLTRVNVVPTSELTNGQLLAEYREIPRIYKLVLKSIDRGEPLGKDVPSEFTYGKGALRFWYNKLAFIKLRQCALRDEMLVRGYKPVAHISPESEGNHGIDHPGYWNDYTPSEGALALNRRRLAIRKWSSDKRAAARRAARDIPKDIEEFIVFL
jgi:hypothetical protein